MSDYNQPEGGEGAERGDDEAVISDTPVDEDNLLFGLTDDQRLDDAKTSSFREDIKNDSFKKRREQLYKTVHIREI
ncbi:Hypothetical predicted protein [Paramuricea clavata]|uniref:Uncharacterized protein n=1 Tax=Paramuricea clavata TaxID=317549 RepID=A0A7D9J9S6_PARCT|nr:Hypothetical predicted protein [Paramuricea clavata]